MYELTGQVSVPPDGRHTYTCVAALKRMPVQL